MAFLHMGLGAAHSAIVQAGLAIPLELRPRATGAICVVQDRTAWWAHVGDSRIYHLRGGQVLRRTRDHSHVELLVQEGLISSLRVQPGDVLLVCTDGFWGPLADEDIAGSLTHEVPLRATLQALTEFAVRRGGPGADNATAAALRLL
jgi:serine/threonine protein phosphatase PrpC